jgi:hypothetical protein
MPVVVVITAMWCQRESSSPVTLAWQVTNWLPVRFEKSTPLVRRRTT